MFAFVLNDSLISGLVSTIVEICGIFCTWLVFLACMIINNWITENGGLKENTWFDLGIVALEIDGAEELV